jgi:hypothetical protein
MVVSSHRPPADLLLSIVKPNATAQARLKAEARDERTL